jgi:hypothetical protein
MIGRLLPPPLANLIGCGFIAPADEYPVPMRRTSRDDGNPISKVVNVFP